MKMHRMLKIVLAAGLATALNCTAGRAQASRDPEIIGTYIGAVLPHVFAVGADTFEVYGGLFTFYLDYNAIGFHEGRSGSTGGVLFAAGKKFSVTGEFTVDPFPSQKTRTMNLYLRSDIQNAGELVAGPDTRDSAIWSILDEVPFGRFSPLYFREDQVSYQQPTAIARLLFASGYPVLPVTAALEAARVSTSRISNLRNKVKVRR